ERAEYARLCALKRRHAAATRLFAGAFAEQPALAKDLQAGHRYNAACSAALAAAGQGADAAGLAAEELAWLRSKALEWLRAALPLWPRALATNSPAARPAVGQRLAHWRAAPDLAGVRDPAALAALPAGERADWQRLWAGVADLLWRIAEAD